MNREQDEDTVSWKIRGDDGGVFSVRVTGREVEVGLEPAGFGEMETVKLSRQKARKLFYQAWQAIDEQAECDR